MTVLPIRTSRASGAEHPIHPLLAERFSPRAFAPTAIRVDELRSMFAAAAWAPSAFNGQPWRFLVGIRGDSTWEAILGSLDSDNRRWAGDAPVLVLNAARVTWKGSPVSTATYDLGQAVAHLTIQALADGIHVHQMSGFEPESLVDAFEFPPEFTPLTVMAVGRLGDSADLPQDLRVREVAPREREPMSTLVFSSTFGKAAPWISDSSN
jgi:nitroreductase